jgi:nitrate reductase alpha subunit
MSLRMFSNFWTTEAAYKDMFVIAVNTDFSDESSCLQYFLSHSSGTSAILVYTLIHILFFPSHSTAHNRGRAANFTDNIFAKRELSVNTLRKVNFSVQHTFRSNH